MPCDHGAVWTLLLWPQKTTEYDTSQQLSEAHRTPQTNVRNQRTRVCMYTHILLRMYVWCMSTEFIYTLIQKKITLMEGRRIGKEKRCTYVASLIVIGSWPESVESYLVERVENVRYTWVFRSQNQLRCQPTAGLLGGLCFVPVFSMYQVFGNLVCSKR